MTPPPHQPCGPQYETNTHNLRPSQTSLIPGKGEIGPARLAVSGRRELPVYDRGRLSPTKEPVKAAETHGFAAHPRQRTSRSASEDDRRECRKRKGAQEMSPPGQSLPRATLTAARSGLLSAPVVLQSRCATTTARLEGEPATSIDQIDRAAESSPVCALAELSLGTTGAVQRHRRRLGKLRIIDPVSPPTSPAKTARAIALRTLGDVSLARSCRG